MVTCPPPDKLPEVILEVTKSLQVAIDPGMGGGIAYGYGGGWITAVKMPPTEEELIAFFKAWISVKATVHVERVSGFIGRGWQPGHHMFKFGKNYGFLLGALKMLGATVVLVQPQAWQKKLGLSSKGLKDRTAWKRFLRDEAQRRHPHLKVTLQTADALLILDAAALTGEAKV